VNAALLPLPSHCPDPAPSPGTQRHTTERAGTALPRDVRGLPAKVPSRLWFPHIHGRGQYPARPLFFLGTYVVAAVTLPHAAHAKGRGLAELRSPTRGEILRPYLAPSGDESAANVIL